MHPALEDLETRNLMSVAPSILGARHRALSPLIHAQVGGGSGGSGGAGSGGGATSGVGFSPLFGSGQPTPHERARQRFHAYFQGPVTVGPGRFSDQAKIIYFRGLGGSNNFMHGDFQMAIVIPQDPTAALLGEAYLEDKNNNSSGQIGFDLTGDPKIVDRAGRPNHLTFTSNPNIYSGIYFANTASGTVDLQYSKGSATVRFTGLVYTTGLTSPIKNSDFYAHGGRITPRS